MISEWKCDYTDEEKGMALTILNKNQEINKLVDELEEQEQHIKEAKFEIERLNNRLGKLEDTLAKIKDLNTMKYLRDDIFKGMLDEILKDSEKE